MRAPMVLAAFWLIAVAAILVLALAGWAHDLRHAYFAAWLILVALPLGALPALMALEITGLPDAAIAVPLRLLLATLPILALLFVPMVFDLGGLYGWVPGSSLPQQTGPAYTGLAAHWFTPFFFGVRAFLYFIVWIGLSLYFLRPTRPSAGRRALAGFGLLAHLFLGTLAAIDWSMSLDQGFVSSAYGLVMISSQCTVALTVALIIGLAIEARGRPDRVALLALLTAALFTIFMQFSQYLVVWSANLPKEIVWYQTRWRDAAGPALVYGAPVLVMLAFLILLPAGLGTLRRPALAGLVALLIAEVFDLAALASPRDTFTVLALAVTLLFVVTLAGLAAGCALIVGRSEPREARHG